jgi:AraC-like DNA-binding protein
MKAQLSTDIVAPRDKVSLWVDIVCAHLVQVSCRHVCEPDRFDGSVSKLALPQLDIARIRAGGQTVCRTTEQISRADDEYLLVNIQRNGHGAVRQHGREAILRPGDFAVYTSASPYELAFDAEFEQTVLILPAATMPGLRDEVQKTSAIRVSGDSATSRLLLTLADSIHDNAEGLPSALLPVLVQTMLQTLTAATSELARRDVRAHDLSRYHLARIKAYASAHLRDPELNVERIAAGAGISVSHLHRLFRHEERTAMDWVREQRLLGCRRDLSDASHGHLSVSDIAFQWGFNDASHFSRAFRARFGMSPRDWRHLAPTQRDGTADVRQP